MIAAQLRRVAEVAEERVEFALFMEAIRVEEERQREELRRILERMLRRP